KRKPRAAPFRRQRRGAAQRVACGAFDFLYGCAEMCEHTSEIARPSRAPDLDNPQMRQRAHHVSPCSNSPRKFYRRLSFLLLTMNLGPIADAIGCCFCVSEFTNNAKRLKY